MTDAGIPRPGPAPIPVDPLAGIDDQLQALDQLPTADHVEVFGRIHTALGSALAGTSADAADDPGPRPESGH